MFCYLTNEFGWVVIWKIKFLLFHFFQFLGLLLEFQKQLEIFLIGATVLFSNANSTWVHVAHFQKQISSITTILLSHKADVCVASFHYIIITIVVCGNIHFWAISAYVGTRFMHRAISQTHQNIFKKSWLLSLELLLIAWGAKTNSQFDKILQLLLLALVVLTK